MGADGSARSVNYLSTRDQKVIRCNTQHGVDLLPAECNLIHMDQTPPLEVTVATRVDAMLDEKGISWRKASEDVGIPFTTLHRRLTGISPFTVTEIGRLAEYLAVDPRALMTQDAA